jgi:diguanylate cyclase (GGDEF)-like protein
MVRLAVFCDPPLRRTLKRAAARGLAYTFFDSRAGAPADLDAFDGVILEVGASVTAGRLARLRKAAGRRPVGGLLVRPDAAKIARAHRAGFDFVLEAWRPGDPPMAAILAHLQASRTMASVVAGRDLGLALKRTAKRLAILTDIVKTANSILEPRKVIELIMGKIQQLIPSEAWSMLMVDEEKQELAFELALGAKGKDVSSYRVKMGEGVAGWVAQTGKPAIVNDAARDRRFTRKFDTKTQFETRSILCAPLISRGRTIGVVEIINRVGGRFTQTDLDILLTLVEPCAIAIENAMLFQRTEQLTITDDLTKLFNSRYMNLYIGREIKRCKRHGIPLSVIFLDLDGFKGINDQYGHLAGSGTLAEVGSILAEEVRESDILARYGGDEFVVVLPETPPGGALVIAERLRRAIEQHSFLGAQGLSARISASFGISSYPDHALTPEGLIQKADQAMYRVKERDKNGIEVAV